MFTFKADTSSVNEKTSPDTSERFVFFLPDEPDTPSEAIELADGADLHIGLDAEWVTRNGSNTVLSYQTYCINDDSREHGQIYYPENGKRFSF